MCLDGDGLNLGLFVAANSIEALQRIEAKSEQLRHSTISMREMSSNLKHPHPLNLPQAETGPMRGNSPGRCAF